VTCSEILVAMVIMVTYWQGLLLTWNLKFANEMFNDRDKGSSLYGNILAVAMVTFCAAVILGPKVCQ